MAQRYEITDSVQKTLSIGAAANLLQVGSGLSAQIKGLQGGNLTVYQSETGATTVANPITTDANGRIEGWVEAPDFEITVSGAGIGTYTQSVRNSPPGTFNVKSYEAKGDGSTDDTAAIQQDFTTAAGRLTVIPYGTYRCLSALTIPSAGLNLWLDDAVLDFSDLAAGSTAILGQGTLGTPVSVNAVAFGATSITGSAGIESGLSAGDTIKLWSADVFDPGQTDSTDGEQCIVLSTASGVINLLGSVMGVYSTTVKIAKVTRIPISIRGTGQILCGGSGSGHKALIAHFANGLRIDGPKLEIRDAEVSGIQIFDTTDYEIGYIDVEGSTDSGTGYGFSAVNTCQNGRVHHSHFRRCRHWTSVNTSSTNNGGINRHLTFEQCYGQYTASGNDGFDSHAGAECLTYDGCEGRDCGNVTFNIEATSATIKHCKSYKSANNGFLVLACSAKSPAYRIVGNEAWDAGGKGVQYSTQTGLGTPSPTTLDIEDNVLVRCAVAAGYVDPGAEHRLRGARMVNNRAYDCGGSGNQVFYFVKGDACDVRNVSINTPNGKIGSRVEDFTKGRFGGLTDFASGGTVRAFYGVGMTDTTIEAVARNATGVGGIGLELDGTSARCHILNPSGLREATTPLVLNSVFSHQVNYQNGLVEIHNADANKTLTPFTSGMQLIWTGAITTNRTAPISTTKAQAGMVFKVARTAAATGVSNVTVGGVKNLAVGQWCEMTYDGSAWVCTAFGSL